MEKENLPQKIKIYSKEIIRSSIKVQLSILGPVGVAIDEMIFGIGDRIRSRRVEFFVDELSNSLNKLKENTIEKKFLESEKFHDLLIQTATQSTKTRHNEKIKIFANILIGSLKVDRDTESLEDSAQIISSLTLKDIQVLKGTIDLSAELESAKLRSDNPQEFDNLINSNKLIDKVDLDEPDIKFSLIRLSTLGLLKEFYAGMVFGGTPGGNYLLTEKLNNIIEIITMPTNEDK